MHPCPCTLPTPLQDGFTPLNNAAFKGHLEIVRLLLDRGADKEARDKVRGDWGGDTPRRET